MPESRYNCIIESHAVSGSHIVGHRRKREWLQEFPLMSNGAAIVTTLRNAGQVLDSFVAYHRAIGFAHLFLFFDDPNDPDLTRAGAMADVTATGHNEALRVAWRGLPAYARLGPFIDSEVMARQQLNAELAMGLARARGYEWLLSIDADELFFSPSDCVSEHFDYLDTTSFETVQYPNYEAVPTGDDIPDCFRSVEFFKPPLSQAQSFPSPALRHATQTISQLRPYFHFYTNGKSAVRLGTALEADGVHRFRRRDGAANNASNTGQFILHYACCGFESFWTKYATLGHFADKWWGQAEIAERIGTFHLESRDVVMSGDRDRAYAFYQSRVAISDALLLERLLGSGVLVRLPQPPQIIEQARRIAAWDGGKLPCSS